MKQILALLFCVPFLMIGCRDQSREAVDERIRNSEALAKADTLCRDLPKPQDFQFVNKIDSGNSFTAGISYLYKSSKSSQEVEEFYKKFFFSNGWKPGNPYNYEKGSQRVSVLPAEIPGSRYSLYCAEIY